ncbi:MAG: hypothetical protein ABEJ22_05020 [Haloferacaceae archaeon]
MPLSRTTRRTLVKALGVAGLTLGTAGAASANEMASVTFEDQTARGTTVEVSEATLPDGGFVVVHDLQDDAAVVGHTGYKRPGTHEDLRIPLDGRASGSGMYLAMAHRNTGRPNYEFPGGDPPYLTSEGSPVVDAAMVTFDTPRND